MWSQTFRTPRRKKVGKKWAKLVKKVLNGVNSFRKNAVKSAFSQKVLTFQRASSAFLHAYFSLILCGFSDFQDSKVGKKWAATVA